MTLAEEAQRYLAAVEVFRAEGYEPRWRPETPLERVHADPREDGVMAEQPKEALN
jgi:hypothetical protein